jgi:hypothetical protein
MSIIGSFPAPDPFYFMRIHSQWLLMALVAALAVAVFYLARPILFAPGPEVSVTAARPVLPKLPNPPGPQSAAAEASQAPPEISHLPDHPEALLAPVRSANARTLDAVSGSVLTAAGTHQLSGSEGLFDRVLIAEGETISLHLEVPNLQPGQEVVITASNGGRLERLNGPLRFVPKDDSASLDLALTPTTGRGVYNIDIRQDGSVASLRFWAGAPLPIGEAGPIFTPLPPQSEYIP